MLKVTFTLGVVVLCGAVLVYPAQSSPQDTAVKEAVQRQHDTLVLRQKLADAQAAQARNDVGAAARLYEEAYKLVQAIGSGIDAETTATVNGLTAVQLELARAALKNGDVPQAKVHATRVVKVNPQHLEGLQLMRDVEARLDALKGRMPDDATLQRARQVGDEKVQAGTHVQNARLLLEAGRPEEAEKELQKAMEIDPNNAQAFYYLSFVKESRYRTADMRREQASKDAIVKVERDWVPPDKAKGLPVPNPYATSKLVHVGKGRQEILAKLDATRLDTVFFDGLPLSEVIKTLSEESKKRDPLKKGINFIINPNAPPVVANPLLQPQVQVIDPATGLALPPAPAEVVDITSVAVKINPAIADMRLADVLDIIVNVAERPIKYSVEEWGVMFSLKGQEAQALSSRRFKVDPNTFYQGLEAVGEFPVGDIVSSSGGGGGGGGGGRGGGGGGGGGGGQSGQGAGVGVPRVFVAGRSGQSGGGGTGGAGGGQGGATGGGVRFLTRTNSMEEVHQAVRNFFTIMGVDLSTPPKTVFFNDRAGELFVRATLEELDIIQEVIEVLNVVPHQINIKAKFAEITQNDNRALGFDWYLGNFLMGGGRMGAQAGTAPSYGGQPSTANPAGSFPGQIITDAAGNIISDTTTPPSASDGLLTGGLRNLANAPALATFSGILTDPQFRWVIKAMEQRDGVDLLNAPEITTPSGRQAQIQVVDIQTIVSGVALNQNTTGGGGGTGATGGTGGGAVGTTIDYPLSSVPVGSTLDVIPYISADGYTIQMTIIPTITEFVGYDDPGQFIPQGQSVSGGGGAGSGIGIPIRAQLPLPRTRLRQVTTSAIVWDGQTVVLGGLISEDVTRLKDKVPVLGDLPLLGKLFRSESSQTKKKNLVIFVTPTIIDPAGNRLHVDGSMPFDPTSIPAGQVSAFDGAVAPAK